MITKNLTANIRCMNGPLEGYKYTLDYTIPEQEIYPNEQMTIDGHSYWIKPETLTDGTFKAWYVTDEVEL